MSPQSPTSTTLNPFAPEYNPIPPGVTPTRNAPPPFFLCPPSSAAFYQPCPPPSSSSLQRPPPVFISPQIFTYITSQPRFYSTNHSTYRVTPHNPTSTTAPPLPPPLSPSQAGVVTHYGPPVRGCTWKRGGRGRGRGRGRENFCSRVEKSGRGFSMGFSKNEKFLSTQCLQKEGSRHKVMPLKRDEEKTTIMIKNIPYDCSRKELISRLDDFCLLENEKAKNEGASKREAGEAFTYAYDFVYLPIDFRSKRSRGFAFVNFTNAMVVWKFFNAFHMKKWDLSEQKKWPKKIEIVSATIQGKEALVNHFTESVFECETDDFLPACFSPPRDGSGLPIKLTVAGNRRAPPLGGARCNHKA